MVNFVFCRILSLLYCVLHVNMNSVWNHKNGLSWMLRWPRTHLPRIACLHEFLFSMLYMSLFWQFEILQLVFDATHNIFVHCMNFYVQLKFLPFWTRRQINPFHFILLWIWCRCLQPIHLFVITHWLQPHVYHHAVHFKKLREIVTLTHCWDLSVKYTMYRLLYRYMCAYTRCILWSFF